MVGICGLHHTLDVPFYADGVIEIGWRFVPESWGKGYATEAASAWLEYGFATLDYPEIVASAVWNNEPSLADMRRIGMSEASTGAFDPPSVPDERPEPKRHRLFRITQGERRARRPA
ncbi:MAG: GNAT family N-acetyltransferase [Methylobacterium mesophilicum]|nr:GNAT family N-acetyltransferase [Methylobacterium mesophilicum]